MLSIIPPTGELDCRLQSKIERQADMELETVIGKVGFPLDGALACILSVIGLLMVAVKGNGRQLVN